MDACAIISANHLGLARVMLTSYRRHNPDGRFFLLLLDEPLPSDDLGGWTIIRAEELEPADLPALRMLYTAYELSMALRPAFLLHLMRRWNANTLVFADADLYFTGGIDHVNALLERHSFILTPSYLTPIPEDGRHPTDRQFLAAGIYNGGFAGCRKCDETLAMLTWLNERLKKYSFLRPEDDMFGDQRWLDLVPSFMNDLLILRDTTTNAAYWNLHERIITQSGGRYFVNGQPMAFFHFSGFKCGSPPTLSVHQTRTDPGHHPALMQLCLEYQEHLREVNHEERKRQPYAFDRFENGAGITPVIRRVYEEIDGPKRFPHPFATADDSFYSWLTTPEMRNGKPLPINRLHRTIHRMSIEASARFPKPASADLRLFALWLLNAHSRVLPLDPIFLEPLDVFVRRSGGEPRTNRMWRCIDRRHSFAPYQLLCRIVKRIIGKKRYDALKPRSEFPTIPRFLLRTHRTGQVGGVNILAGIGAENGVGEAVRGHFAACRAADLPVAVSNAHTAPGRERIVLPEQVQDECMPFATTLMEGGLHDLHRGLQMLPRGGTGSRVIGHLAWELETIPEKTVGFLNQFDELWVASRFIRDGVSDQLSIPVLTMPYVVDVSGVSQKSRKDFNIPEDTTVFLFVFDFYSHIERKNPLGLLQAFRKAFGDDPSKLLLIKHSHGEAFPDQWQQLQDAASASANIRLMGTYIPRPDLLGLLRCADAYVSLHRAEGFGLTMAEAMALGVPVIGTEYGGSTEFLTDRTGFPIPFSLQTISRTIDPYEKGMRWAEPDLTAAAEAMRSIISKKAEAETRAARAKTFIERNFSAKNIGQRMKKRLERLETTR
ncbi:MAG: glycosyltransferase family 4 protein [Candidatus Peribacteraceae bacterium]|nr:glycosyltransferase family 4 protein [Candidatus Peribacteraceae bacterium]